MADVVPQAQWDYEIAAGTERAADWLWHGFVGKGNTTLLTSMWKAGKTTLLSMLLSLRKTGGTLAGLAVKPGKTVVISEEHTGLWAERARRYDFGGNVCFFCRPFRNLPTPQEWQALISRILELRQEHRFDLAVIDPLAPYLRGENQARNIFDALLPLGALTQAGMGLMILHHPGKGEKPIGQAARGSGALLGHVDISIEMRHPGGDPYTRRRRFHALSRHADTPRRLFLELNPEATDYLPVPDTENDCPFQWNVLSMVLEDAQQKLTRRDILAEWPEDFDKPSPVTLYRWLKHALDNNMIRCEGTGRNTDPFRYWLPAREEIWKENPFYEICEQQRRDLNRPWESLTERKCRSAESGDSESDVGEAA